MVRNAVLALALALIGGLAALTLAGVRHQGFSGLTIVSLIVLVVLGVGVLGALTSDD